MIQEKNNGKKRRASDFSKLQTHRKRGTRLAEGGRKIFERGNPEGKGEAIGVERPDDQKRVKVRGHEKTGKLTHKDVEADGM